MQTLLYGIDYVTAATQVKQKLNALKLGAPLKKLLLTRTQQLATAKAGINLSKKYENPFKNSYYFTDDIEKEYKN